MKTKIIFFLFVIAGLYACEEDPVENIYTGFSKGSGVFISCEGNFMYGNASLSFYDKQRKKVFNRIYFARNGVPLGDIAQSLASDGSRLFIVVNNSGKVVATDLQTVEQTGIIKDLVSPRYIHVISKEKAYISDLYAKGITIFNPGTLIKSGFISLPDGKKNSSGHSTESFVQVNADIFVSCWSYNDQIMVIDSKTDAVIDSIKVPFQPKKMVTDCHNKIWLFNDGDYGQGSDDSGKPSLVRIDPESRSVEKIMIWNLQNKYLQDIRTNPAKDTLYIIAGDLYKMGVSSNVLPGSKPFIEAGKHVFYSLGVDPSSGEIYVADVIDYSQDAMIYRFSAAGLPIDSFRVGINPGDFLFY
jgi:DNA-binding beta-propeller fold protein YncE